ncbi:MAG: hypothetical protein ACHQQQ_03460 [Bacteroidota bacterium]
MKQTFTYRLITVALVVLFSVCNIGLPIVIASCPMMKTGNKLSCCAVKPAANHTQSIAREKSSDCCKTVIAGERNTTEFVQSHFQLQQTQAPVGVLAPVIDNCAGNLVVSRIASIQLMPPLLGDIPILNSSLLI